MFSHRWPTIGKHIWEGRGKTSCMDESEYWNRVETRLKSLSDVESIKRIDGEHDYIAGQRDIRYTEYRLNLTQGVISSIEAEQEDSVDGISEELSRLRNNLELNLNVSPGDYEDGSLYVTAEYDNYPGGSN